MVNPFLLHLEEIKLRGAYISMAVDIDFMLAMILEGIYINNLAEIKTLPLPKTKKNKELHELNLFEKIYVCKHGLNKYHNEFYKKYQRDLDSFDKLRKLRNYLAHQKMDFKTDNSITFTDIIKGCKTKETNIKIDMLWKKLVTTKDNIMRFLNLILTFIISQQPSAS